MIMRELVAANIHIRPRARSHRSLSSPVSVLPRTTYHTQVQAETPQPSLPARPGLQEKYSHIRYSLAGHQADDQACPRARCPQRGTMHHARPAGLCIPIPAGVDCGLCAPSSSTCYLLPSKTIFSFSHSHVAWRPRLGAWSPGGSGLYQDGKSKIELFDFIILRELMQLFICRYNLLERTRRWGGHIWAAVCRAHRGLMGLQACAWHKGL